MKRYRDSYEMAIYAILIVVVFVVLIFAGCSRKQITNGQEIHSHMTREQAFHLAQRNAELVGGVFYPLSCSSDSMGWALSCNAYIVCSFEWDQVEPGMVIAARDGNHIVLHMVVYRSGNNVKTAGVNNHRSDPHWVNKNNYLGTMVVQVYFQEES